MSKQYPLELENIGQDVYTLMSRGHHDLEVFKIAVKDNYPSWVKSLGKPIHTYFKRVFNQYIQCSSDTKGCFPATLISEGE